MAVELSDKRSLESQDEDPYFFLPDFCAIQPVFILVLVSELLAIVLVVSGNSLLEFDWVRFALTSLFVQWVSLSSAFVLCYTRPMLQRWPHHWSALASYAIILGITAVFSLLEQWFLYPANSTGVAFVIDWYDLYSNVLISAIIGGMVLRYFYVQEHLHSKNRSELLHRIQALQSRIKPHFLFNSMNIVASLIATDPDTAEQVIEDLSDLFRASLNHVGNQVTFDEELKLCQRYIRIEQLRLGDRLQMHWSVADDLPSSLRIPLLTLQPLLENAILHGVQSRPEGGEIRVVARYNAPNVELVVTNPLPAQAPSSFSGNRMALKNIRHRLTALYGEKARVTSGPQANLYVVFISYPVQR